MTAVLDRRRLMLGAAGLVLARSFGAAVAAPEPARFVAGKRVLDILGKAAPVLGLDTGMGPVARFGKGDRFAVTLDNRLDEPTLVHWHGLTPPSAQDGVPDLSQPALPPGASYAYDFPLTRSGTFWMHSHAGFQRAQLLAAPLIVADPQDKAAERQEVVIFLADFSFRAPEEVFAGLTGGHGGMKGMAGMDHSHMNHGQMDHAHMDHSAMPGGMSMDVNDIDFDAYLANDRTLADPEIVRVEPGGRVRLRVINGAAATNFWLDLGALTGELIAVDGDPVVPVKAKRFPIAMAQRLDIALTLPPGQGAYPILALREGAKESSGVVLATTGAKIAKLGLSGATATKPIGPDFEQRLTAAQPLPRRKLNRRLAAELTGDMMSYAWGINGNRYGEDTPLRVKAGERVEIAMENRTAMAHPMHLHGHHFQVVAINGRRLAGAVRDTVLVPAMGAVSIAFDADNPGKWAFHCHNEYHMAAGMMTSVQYES